MKKYVFMPSVVAVCALMSAHGSFANADDLEIRIAEVNDATTFDPHLATDNTTIAINEHFYEGLLARAPSGELVPALAESWEVDESQTVWTFQLRDGVTFSDGAEFDAEAVRMNIERILDPEFGAAGRARLSGLSDVEVVDSMKIQMTTEYPWPALLDGLAGNSTRMISPAALENEEHRLERNPVGTGPYVLDDWRTGQEIVLARNDDYWGQAGIPDRIIVQPTPEASVRASLLQAGEIDIALKINPENVATLENDPNTVVVTAPSTFSVFYMFNMHREPLDDPRIREAINIAIDREAIVNSILSGAATVPRGFFAGAVPYRTELDPIPYDPDRARELLAEAGYPDGLELKLWTAPRYQNDRQVAEAVQAYLRQIGVSLDIEMNDWGTHWSNINQRDKDVDLYLLATTIPEPAYRLEWNFGRDAGGYWSGYGGDEFWDLLAEASRTIDEDAAAELFGDLQEMVWNDLPYLFLYDRILINGTGVNVSGLQMDGREIWDLTSVEK